MLFASAIVSLALVSCNNTSKTEGGEGDSTSVDSTTEVLPTVVMVGEDSMFSNLDIVDNAVKAKGVTTLVAAVQAAGLVETLKGAGPFTVFAPTNDAFAALPKGTVEGLLKPEAKDKLVSILTYHVVAGALTADSLTDGKVLTTVNGGELKVTVKEGKVFVNGVEVIIPNVISSNGVTHVIGSVLLPTAKK